MTQVAVFAPPPILPPSFRYPSKPRVLWLWGRMGVLTSGPKLGHVGPKMKIFIQQMVVDNNQFSSFDWSFGDMYNRIHNKFEQFELLIIRGFSVDSVDIFLLFLMNY